MASPPDIRDPRSDRSGVAAQRAEDDEIDLLELAATLWAGRRLVAIAVVLAVLLGSTYLNLAERRYTVSLVLKPLHEGSQGASLSGLAGLAGIAGIELPSGSTADFSSFPMMLQSREVAVRVAQDAALMQGLFDKEWDEAAQVWRRPARPAWLEAASRAKSLVSGDPKLPYEPPGAARLAEHVSEEISAAIDTKSGLLRISAEAADPALAQRLIERLVAETDKLFRERFIAAGSSGLEFYKAQLAKARSAEHREALARMIVQEEQKLMLATRSSNYVADVLTGPDVSLRPTSPRSMLVLALSLVLGLFSGVGLVLIRAAMTKRGEP